MRYVLTALLLFIINCASAQFFTLTHKGFINAGDSTKNYYVMTDFKLNKSQLYKESLLYFNKVFSSPKDVISTVDGETITLNFFDQYKIIMGSMWNVNLTYVIEFKDNKVKITAPNINKIYNEKYQTISINANDSEANFPIYKRNGNGDLRGGDGLKSKNILEGKVNTFVLYYLNQLIKQEDKKEDNW